ncbi:MAG TPA: DUF4442 domain-containing protein [Burkholderiales bacterium]|nr:DUF4442 domain-containing protein [Burkholderiales bacterium]
MLNLWPPFRCAGIRVRRISADWRVIDVELRLGLLNRNYMGSHFGGSLFSMTDPFFWLIVMRALGPDYVVSHKGGRIDFFKPGRSHVRAHFEVDDEALDDIRARTANGERDLPEFSTDIVDENGEVIARATQILHIRRKTAV